MANFTGKILQASDKRYKCSDCGRRIKRAFCLDDGTAVGVECFVKIFGVNVVEFRPLAWGDGKWLITPGGLTYWCMVRGSKDQLMRMVVYESDDGWRGLIAIGNNHECQCEQKWFKTVDEAKEYCWRMMRKYMDRCGFDSLECAIYEEAKVILGVA